MPSSNPTNEIPEIAKIRITRHKRTSQGIHGLERPSSSVIPISANCQASYNYWRTHRI